MQWYNVLINKKEMVIRSQLEDACFMLSAMGGYEPEDVEPQNNMEDPQNTDSPAEATQEVRQELLRPSEYLRRRCPLCFGGQNCHDPNSMSVVSSLNQPIV